MEKRIREIEEKKAKEQDERSKREAFFSNGSNGINYSFAFEPPDYLKFTYLLI